MIENMFGQSKLNNNNAATSASSLPSAEAASLLQGVSSAAMSAAPTTIQPLQFISDANTLDNLISQYKAVAVMFTSATCPPCKIIKPKFIEMIEQMHEGKGEIKVLGLVVDTMAFHSPKYNIRAVPTFNFFLNGQKTSEFSGANYAELKSQVDMLLFEAFPRKFDFC